MSHPQWNYWRFDIIKALLKKCNGKRFLEIGVEDGDNIRQIKCDTVHGVDPATTNATHRLTSDEFFAMLAADYKYDVVFVDGLHVADQAQRDIENALLHLNDGGYVVVHDCNPPTAWHQRSESQAAMNGHRLWNGTVYKAIIQLRATRDDLHIQVVDTDWGCAVIRRVAYRSESNKLDECAHIEHDDIEYEWFAENRERLLNLVSVEEFRKEFE